MVALWLSVASAFTVLTVFGKHFLPKHSKLSYEVINSRWDHVPYKDANEAEKDYPTFVLEMLVNNSGESPGIVRGIWVKPPDEPEADTVLYTGYTRPEKGVRRNAAGVIRVDPNTTEVISAHYLHTNAPGIQTDYARPIRYTVEIRDFSGRTRRESRLWYSTSATNKRILTPLNNLK